jgi:hypothetical protein
VLQRQHVYSAERPYNKAMKKRALESIAIRAERDRALTIKTMTTSRSLSRFVSRDRGLACLILLRFAKITSSLAMEILNLAVQGPHPTGTLKTLRYFLSLLQRTPLRPQIFQILTTLWSLTITTPGPPMRTTNSGPPMRTTTPGPIMLQPLACQNTEKLRHLFVILLSRE